MGVALLVCAVHALPIATPRNTSAAAAPGGGGYDEATALSLARFAASSYCDDSAASLAALRSWRCGVCQAADPQFVGVKYWHWDSLNMGAYAGYSPALKRVVVAFKGTEPSSLDNWIQNLKIAHEKVDMNISGCAKCEAHDGCVLLLLLLLDHVVLLAVVLLVLLALVLVLLLTAAPGFWRAGRR